jgi:hypothetical protein
MKLRIKIKYVRNWQRLQVKRYFVQKKFLFFWKHLDYFEFENHSIVFFNDYIDNHNRIIKEY